MVINRKIISKFNVITAADLCPLLTVEAVL